MRELKIWYVDFPTHQYNEDVKELALRGGFKVIDSRYQGDDKSDSEAPKLTKKGDKKNPPLPIGKE